MEGRQLGGVVDGWCVAPYRLFAFRVAHRPRVVYPHLYAQLEGENVDSFKELVRGGEPGKEEDWETVLERARAEGWLQP